MTSIHIVLIAYALDIVPLVQQLDGENTYFHIFIHSRRPEACKIFQWIGQGHINKIVHDYGTNRGLARSWNDSIAESLQWNPDAILIVNDDIAISRQDMLKLAQGCVDHPEAGIVTPRGFNERMDEQQDLQFAVFGINRIALETVGYFDQNFTPIYYEDSDYSRRAYLTGLKYHNIGDTSIVHKGSATVGTVAELARQNNLTFRASGDYYVNKWGGYPGSETYPCPFYDKRYGLRIAVEERDNPYPGHERHDLEIVKI